MWHTPMRSPRAAMPPFRLPQNNILRRAVGSSQLLFSGAEPQGHLRSREEQSPPGQPNLGQAAPAALPEVARRGRSNREPPRQTSIGSSAATGSV